MSAPDACQRLANGIADALEMDGEGCPTETQTPREAIAEAFRRELPVIFGDLFADYARTVRLDDDTTAKLLRNAAGFIGAFDDFAARGRNAVVTKDLLRLIFMHFHGGARFITECAGEDRRRNRRFGE